jgi:histone deacetylase 1/2
LQFGNGSSSSANSTGRGGSRGGSQQMRGSNRGRGGRQNSGRGFGGPGGRGFGSGRGRGQQQMPRQNQQRRSLPTGPTATYNNFGRPICQVCFKTGHTAIDCWHRFDENYVPEEHHIAAAMSLYSSDQNWYMDSGATDNITSDLEKLAVRDKYHGGDQIHTTSGAGMEIKHIGHSLVHTPTRNLHLNNILHVPKAAKNLVSVHRLTKDNSAFLEFHPEYFFDQGSGHEEHHS